MSEQQVAKVQELESGQIEIVVQKGFGGSEQINARLITTREDMKKDVEKVYKDVFTPRADTFATEVANYQLKMNGVNRVLEEEELLEAGREEEAKKGKKDGK